VTVRFVHWQDGCDYLGYLMDYPDYMTQGTSMEDLQEHLVSLYKDLTSGELSCVRTQPMELIAEKNLVWLEI
jgi:hypothetical protein